MIILPQRKIPRSKFLLPQRPSEWRQPSQRTTTFGIEDQTRWRITARLSDGAIVWRGWFDDRDDADAFLFALATGSLRYEPELWSLPSPTWCPGMGESLAFDFATVTFLTSPTGSNQTYTRPFDWNNSNNSIECIGGGGGGGNLGGGGGGNGAGGGGGYSAVTNLSISSTAAYQIGPAGVGGPAATPANGTAGGDTWFNGATLAASSVGAKGGAGNNVATGGAGGAAGSGAGAIKFSGGTGGSTVVGSGAGVGGGGAGGPHGNGGNGGITVGGNAGPGGGAGGGGSAGGNSSGSTFGVGGNNYLGSGGGASPGASGTNSGGGAGMNSSSGVNAGSGGAGTDWDASHGSGGAGGGGRGAGDGAGGDGGLYGAAGGSCGFGKRAGNGAQGLIVVTYTPLKFVSFNMPMLGM